MHLSTFITSLMGVVASALPANPASDLVSRDDHVVRFFYDKGCTELAADVPVHLGSNKDEGGPKGQPGPLGQGGPWGSTSGAFLSTEGLSTWTFKYSNFHSESGTWDAYEIDQPPADVCYPAHDGFEIQFVVTEKELHRTGGL